MLSRNLSLGFSLGNLNQTELPSQQGNASVVMAHPYTAILSIYAELLSNIRQVSVRATLSSPSDATTKAEILDDGRRIQVHHQGESRSLDLPASVLVRAAIPIPENCLQDLAWRLPVPAAETELTRFSAESQSVPWSSPDIKIGSRICCRHCDYVFIQPGRIKSWKDLPSENWAEMMEFWHCHKPHQHEHHDGEALSKRGYGANSAITSQSEVGFVDLTSFMFSESDCDGLLFSHPSSDASFDTSKEAMDGTDPVKPLRITCQSCSAEIGIFNALASSVTLFKWQVTCETASPGQAPSSSECLAATLIATISRSGSSKSVVASHTLGVGPEGTLSEPPRSLHLWVLNANVVYSSTMREGRRAAIKILYQDIDVEQGNKLVDSMTSGVQEISFPAAAIKAARQILQESNCLMPISERLFQQWHVGLLERWG
ncbi:ubiquitin-conjugating enzyme e2c-binding [Trichoderma arundinaceum]|uniref:Ubiquitin-conjugating enzyme e2c-binding n=1 Tax=Trichoderma arundinaceum TaxID=490622 RepID=A0A395ND11_TRIAR|nr:ubiquitin-conjugating enzyme e2c-binding [Trichoderma arundinaceum]